MKREIHQRNFSNYNQTYLQRGQYMWAPCSRGNEE